MTAFANLCNAYFKFVIVEPSDVDEVDELLARYEIPLNRVLLMPEGTTPEALTSRSEWIAELCSQKGFRFTTRLHILLWGDKRGR